MIRRYDTHSVFSFCTNLAMEKNVPILRVAESGLLQRLQKQTETGMKIPQILYKGVIKSYSSVKSIDMDGQEDKQLVKEKKIRYEFFTIGLC